MLEPAPGEKPPRELAEITAATDTRDYLKAATRQSQSYDDFELIVDVDAHLQEGGFWHEIIGFLENDVLQQTAQAMMRPGALPLINMQPGMTFQALAGRIPHQAGPQETTEDPAKAGHRFVQIVRRTIDAMGLDYQVIFPTAMLHLGMNPMEEIEVEMARAYCRWLAELILPADPRIIGLIYLPFNSPLECEKLVRDYGNRPGIVGFTVCAVRHKPVHHNQYARLYAMIEESGKPLVFHAGPHWDDPSFTQLNRFISMHALSFVHYNLIHMTNWVINAMPERYPRMKLIWVESGLAWVPFLMQRLDHEVMMRQSEAPGLKRLPSEYMREMYYSSQPLERNDLELLGMTMKKIKAETQLLYSSDWPHWDFDPPSAITTLPFLSEQAKRNILGLNAARVFNLPVKRVRPHARDVMAARVQEATRQAAR
jgi:predicted TIM-barrel fold metal-dependent hydrolase